MQFPSYISAPAAPASNAPIGDTDVRRTRFSRYAWFLLVFNFLVIAVGTIVRATGSGDGCGNHWPLCNGETIPVAPAIKTVIEFTHRLVSGLDGILVLGLLVGSFLLYPRRHPVRAAAIATFILTGIEAWIGAVLVKKRLVADNASAERAVWMAIHLTNTFFLLTSLTLAAWWAGGGERLRLRGQGALGASLLLGFAAMIALGASGAVTALGDTLFPVRDHAEAVQQAQATGANFLQQLRLLHPYIAGSVGLYLVLIAGLTAHLRPTAGCRLWASRVGCLFLIQIGLGLVNVALRAPVWMQVVHLVMSDLIWVSVTLLTLSALSVSAPQVELGANATEAMVEAASHDYGRPTWRDYLLLTKPRVISLLLFTTLAAMFIAAGGWPGATLFFAVALGGYMSAGAANAINMVIDRDIDVRMKRTASRPTVTQKIPSRNALVFGLTLGLLSFALLWVAANLLTAMLSLAGLVFYVIVYTLLLKRRTWHNIVIGGAAGAFPPLVGWAAVTNGLSPLALFLFAIVFAWTPAHFWALALLIKDDYADAGVPMAPVVLGERLTVIQISLYAILTAIVSLLPLAGHLVGLPYFGIAVLLNILLLVRTAQLYFRTDRPRALSMYKYSMLYLFLLFLAMAVDSGLRGGGHGI